MQPIAARSSRSSIIYPIAPLANTYVQQHQPQCIVYGPITTIQASNRILQSNDLYSRNQKYFHQITPMQTDDKINVWTMKNKMLKSQRYCQNQFIHPSNPVLVYKQPINNFYSSQNQSNTSFLFSSSNFSPNYYTEEYYSNPNITTVLSHPYYKSVDLQHPNSIYTSQQQPQEINSYYMAATNTSNLQIMNITSNYDQPTLQQYKTQSAHSKSQVPVIQNVAVYPNMRMGLVINKSTNEKVDVTPANCTPNKLVNNISKRTTNDDSNWFPHSSKMLPRDLYNITNYENNSEISDQNGRDLKTYEEKLSEASSTSFDFTIEAEKMVSALCDIKSPKNLKKGNTAERIIVDEMNENNWFLDLEYNHAADDTCTNKSVATQTQEICNNEQLSELIRRIALWGCAEAEIILKSSRYCQDSKYVWLSNLLTATKTAITKSSTSSPIFGDDHVLMHDLINALLRISNGWLTLDNYLNKHYYLSLEEKFDIKLNRCFQNWESKTHDLLKCIVQTFQKIKQSISCSEPEQKQEMLNPSFPDNVSLYSYCDFFDPFASHPQQSITTIGLSPVTQSSYSSSYFLQSPNFQYMNCQQSIKESKLHTKWTITENTSAKKNSSKQNNNCNTRNSNFSNMSFQKSLNAEFSHLKNKVMESTNFVNTNSSNNQKIEYSFTNKNPFTFSIENQTRQKVNLNLPDPKSTLAEPGYYQKSVFPELINTNHRNSNIQFTDHINTEHLKYINNKYNTDSVYTGKTLSNEFKLVPKTKMTLLSQIEPNVNKNTVDQQEITAHLSAWFARMRNVHNESNLNEKCSRTIPNRQLDATRNALNLSKQLKMDTNRQLLTLKNMQSIQSAPWSAFNLLNENKSSIQKRPEEWESSEDLRVYMKPGSYNVPKKRHQKKPSNYQPTSKNDSRFHKNYNYCDKDQICSISSSLPSFSYTSTNSASNNNTRLISSNNSHNSSLKKESKLQRNDNSILHPNKLKDSTWKVACASAEILLEALNVSKRSKDCNNSNESSIDVIIEDNYQNNEKFTQHKNVSESSSYEPSEEECVNVKQISACDNIKSSEYKDGRNNVKTDFWLLKTLKLKSLNKINALENKNCGSSDFLNSIPQEEYQSLKDLNKEQGNHSKSHVVTYSDMTRKEFVKISKVSKKYNTNVSLTSKLNNGKITEQSRKSKFKKNFKNYQVTKGEEKLYKWTTRHDPEEDKELRKKTGKTESN